MFAALRRRVTVPLAAGEQFGDLRDGNLPLVEQGLIDYLRTSIPNCGGITAYRKLAALCEAHSVGLVPRFTPPIGTAAVAPEGPTRSRRGFAFGPDPMSRRRLGLADDPRFLHAREPHQCEVHGEDRADRAVGK